MLTTAPLNILIVEDNPGDQFLITELLESAGIKIKSLLYAGTMKETLQLLKKEQVNIMLLDLSLPDSLGIETFNTVKKIAPETPIVILSGFTDMKLALEAITLGAQDYLIKGDFDEKLLSKTILYSIERWHSLKAIELAEQTKKQEITEAVISAQEIERQEIGRELHDNINQILASARLYLGLIDENKESTDSFSGMADKLIGQAIAEIRSLSHALIAPSLERANLSEALDQILNTLHKTTGVTIEKDILLQSENLMPDKLKLTIYRIVQEQLNNIQKYANAKTINIKLSQEDKKIYLLIRDDGIGFDITKKQGGIGLTNIKSRASLFKGEMNIVSSPGNGCELSVVFN